MLDRSPLELLASFAICFASGFVAKIAMDAWAKKVRHDAQREASAST